MTKLTQRVAIGTTENPEPADPQTQSGPLLLTGNQPVTVFMQPCLDAQNKAIASFASSSTGPFFLGGLQWQADAEHALFVNFIFQVNTGLPTITITSFDCDAPIPLLYTAVGSDKVSQSCAIPPLAGTYRFFVIFSTGERHDPQIVVTPQ